MHMAHVRRRSPRALNPDWNPTLVLGATPAPLNRAQTWAAGIIGAAAGRSGPSARVSSPFAAVKGPHVTRGACLPCRRTWRAFDRTAPWRGSCWKRGIPTPLCRCCRAEIDIAPVSRSGSPLLDLPDFHSRAGLVSQPPRGAPSSCSQPRGSEAPNRRLLTPQHQGNLA